MRVNLHGYSELDARSDFRGKATLGVALVAIALLFPVSVMDFIQSRIFIGAGSLGIVLCLIVNAWLVMTNRCHQKLTLYILVPAGMLFMTRVFYEDGYIGSLWCYPSMVACYCMLSGKRANLANAMIFAIAAPMAYATLPLEHALRIWATLLATSLFAGNLVRVIDKQQNRAHDLLIHDSLTGLLNRFTLSRRLNTNIENHAKTGIPACLLAIDIDHFKRVNDEYGHDAGDKVLVELGRLLRENLRETDSAFRSGGEEFLVLLEQATVKEARCTAHRLRHLVELADLVPGQSITVSIGISPCEFSDDWTHWMKRADENLYKAKNLGRNRVVVSAHLSSVESTTTSTPVAG
ncbi:MAG: GGDEF domain-containing protein [Granulosicoccus sp.]